MFLPLVCAMVELMLCVATLYHMDLNTAVHFVLESRRVVRAGGSVYILKAVSPISQALDQEVSI